MEVKINPALCKQINRTRLNILTFGHAFVGSEWQGGIISPSHSKIHYFPIGGGTIKWSGGEFSIKDGMWYLVPSGCSFEFSGSEGMEQYYFHLKFCDFDETDLLSAFGHPVEFRFPEISEETLKRCINSDSFADSLEISHAIYKMLSALCREYGIDITRPDYSPCVYAAISYIRQNLSMKLTVEKVANDTFASKSTLSKKFKKEIGVGVNQYISSNVLFEAEKLLVSTNMSVAAISDKLGFSDQFYFSRKFKEAYDVSPIQYRRRFHF